MQVTFETTKYILSFVEAEIAALEVERQALKSAEFISELDYWTSRDVNHGQLPALAKVRGRLQAMIEIQGWNTTDGTVPHWEGK